MKAPIAFEVPGQHNDAEEQESIIQAHPPRRLRRLEEEMISNLSQEELERRHAKAEQRRQEVF